MRILLLTAGAAGMYCGSCIQDNALAAALISAGQDVLLVPLYTPTLTDETNVSQKKIFFGGISVYLQQRFRVFRKTPWLLDRLWDSPLALKLASGRGVSNDPGQLGELTLSMLSGEEGRQAKEFRKLLHWLKEQNPPDVIHISNSLLSGLAGTLKRELRCPLFCTLQGEHLFLDQLPERDRARARERIRGNLGHTDACVAVSEFYAGFMADYLGLAASKIHVVPLGMDWTDYDTEAPRAEAEAPFRIGFLARIAPEKGLHVLGEAYRTLRLELGLPASRLEAAGYMAPQQESYLEQVRAELMEVGLGAEFQYHGSLDRRQKVAFLRGLDVFSVPATYDEPKGLSVLEAMAAGVPVVQPARGSFPEMIRKTEGGLEVEAAGSRHLAAGILSLFRDRSLALRLGRNGYRGARLHYGIEGSAQRMLELYRRFVPSKDNGRGQQVHA